MSTPIIAHLDMDAFFAAVEERDKPWLKGLPICVGADPKGGQGRGIVATANYPARKYGLHSALPITRAWRYSEEARGRGEPSVVFLTPSFAVYRHASEEVMTIAGTYTSQIQITSVDEAYLDLSHTGSFLKAKKLCNKLKEEIREKTKLSCSIGIGPNKMIAKIGSDFEKPDGLTLVASEQVQVFLDPLPVRAIPGVGPKTEQRLRNLGVQTIGQLREIPEETLSEKYGKMGKSLFKKARGEGSVTFTARVKNKSIGEHRTFSEDTRDLNFVMKCLSEMAGGIYKSVQKKGFKGFRTVVVTVRFADFDTKTRSLTSSEPLLTKQILESRGLKLLLPFFEKRENPNNKAIRMIGIRVEKLV